MEEHEPKIRNSILDKYEVPIPNNTILYQQQKEKSSSFPTHSSFVPESSQQGTLNR